MHVQNIRNVGQQSFVCVEPIQQLLQLFLAMLFMLLPDPVEYNGTVFDSSSNAGAWKQERIRKVKI